MGILIFSIYRKDVQEHTSRVAASRFIKRIIYIVAFIVSVLAWPLLIGA